MSLTFNVLNVTTNHRAQSKLNRRQVAHIILTAETEDFDAYTKQQWVDEGFDVRYIPLLTGGIDYIQRIQDQGDAFGFAEHYAIVAYGTAASMILDAHTKPISPRVVAIVAYYPDKIPGPNTEFALGLQVMVHLAGEAVGTYVTPETLGFQHRRRLERKRISRGPGFGSRLSLSFSTYSYGKGVEPGFAEQDLDEFNPTAAGLAFSRSLACVKSGFRIDPSRTLEAVRDRIVQAAFFEKPKGKSHEDRVSTVTKHMRNTAQVVHVPTLTGGVGCSQLIAFYRDMFPALSTATDDPNDMRFQLLSRTVGADRVVDELAIRLTHNRMIPWLLPGIEPTGKAIEFSMVTISHIRGDKLESEHVYWDQAGVLLQAGLLDPAGVIPRVEDVGVPLPITGAEQSRLLRRGGHSKALNLLARRGSRGY